MEPLLTPTEMTEADRRAVASGTSVSVLMERAGRAVAWEVRRVLGGAYGHRAVVVCGKGNNGGDGLVAARVLRGWGVRCDVFELADEPDQDRVLTSLARADVLVDAMYGTGFTGTLHGIAAAVAERSAARTTVAVDIPSGVDGSTGAINGPAVQATTTVTFAARKPGTCFEPGRSRAGDVRVVDIGIDVGAPAQHVVAHGDIAAWLVPRAPDAHKWSAGLLVVGGSAGMTGAPMLVGEAAMRTGAGIVWCAIPGGATAGATELVVKDMPSTTDGAIAAVAPEVMTALGRFRAAVVGPGLGTADETRSVVHALIGAIPVPLVLDADGVNAFTGDAAALRSRPAPTVLTPHAAEYERLLGEPVGTDRLAAARRLADATAAVVLLKGPGTVVAEPGDAGRTAVVVNGNAALATAGSGDVLSGIVGGLLARGLGPFEAAAGGAWLHGRAADLAGHTGLVAGDLVRALPASLHLDPSRHRAG
ncbi:MAG TPA: NAD(P)H-hydrate dehydratase [Acidimicrobiia bacterium]|nr:NAD(P)H-hydrate dehydratase [Acidimicrobiia bacterium]